jgi:hypothetical protein
MQFGLKDESGNNIPLPVRVKPAEDYAALYAHGAQGGFLGNYHFRMDFYRETMPPLEYTELPGGRASVDDVRNRGVDRLIIASVYVPVPFVKEMVTWLTNHIEQYERQFGEIKLLTPEEVETEKE